MTGAAPLRILILEDMIADAELMVGALRGAGLSCEHRRASTRPEFLQQLAQFAPDVILADYSLPGFDALSALNLARKLGPAIPFIVVTGRLDEETALACVRAGADDFVLKDHLLRLPVAVKVALECHQARTQLRRAEEAYRFAVENSGLGLIVLRGDQVVFVNQFFADTFGYSADAILTMRLTDLLGFIHPEDAQAVLGRFRARVAGKSVDPRHRLRTLDRDGGIRWFDMFAANILYDGEPAVQATLLEVTDWQRLLQAERAAADVLRAALDGVPVPIFWKDRASRYLGGNRSFLALVGLETAASLAGRADADLCWTPQQATWLRECDRETREADTQRCFCGPLRLADGRSLSARLILAPLGGSGGGGQMLLGHLETGADA